jgi:hypothetical protein
LAVYYLVTQDKTQPSENFSETLKLQTTTVLLGIIPCTKIVVKGGYNVDPQ